MELNDVYHGYGDTYYCRNSQTRCYILASHSDDGACLIAEKCLPNGNIGGEMFTTEACYLTPWKLALKTVVEYCANCHEAVRPDEMGGNGQCRTCCKKARHVLAAEQGTARLKSAYRPELQQLPGEAERQQTAFTKAVQLGNTRTVLASFKHSIGAMTDEDMIQWLRDICGNDDKHTAYMIAERLQQLTTPDTRPTCYQCEKPTDWLAPDSRCGDCTRLTVAEIKGPD